MIGDMEPWLAAIIQDCVELEREQPMPVENGAVRRHATRRAVPSKSRAPVPPPSKAPAVEPWLAAILRDLDIERKQAEKQRRYASRQSNKKRRRTPV